MRRIVRKNVPKSAGWKTTEYNALPTLAGKACIISYVLCNGSTYNPQLRTLARTHITNLGYRGGGGGGRERGRRKGGS